MFSASQIKPFCMDCHSEDTIDIPDHKSLDLAAMNTQVGGWTLQ